jgi:hypothetical protein
VPAESEAAASEASEAEPEDDTPYETSSPEDDPALAHDEL